MNCSLSIVWSFGSRIHKPVAVDKYDRNQSWWNHLSRSAYLVLIWWFCHIQYVICDDCVCWFISLASYCATATGLKLRSAISCEDGKMDHRKQFMKGDPTGTSTGNALTTPTDTGTSTSPIRMRSSMTSWSPNRFTFAVWKLGVLKCWLWFCKDSAELTLKEGSGLHLCREEARLRLGSHGWSCYWFWSCKSFWWIKHFLLVRQRGFICCLLLQLMTGAGRTCPTPWLPQTPSVETQTTSISINHWLRTLPLERPLQLAFWLSICKWLILRLRCLHVWLLYEHLICSSIWHAWQLVLKRPLWSHEVLIQVIFESRRTSLP